VREVATRDAARAGIRAKTLDIVAIGDNEILTNKVPESGDSGKKPQLIAAVGLTVRLQGLIARQGPDALATASALQQPVPVNGTEPKQVDTQQRIVAFFGVLILFFFLQQYGSWVLNGWSRCCSRRSSRVSW
jgi:hypothetical protein